jgi:hypothetical protein
MFPRFVPLQYHVSSMTLNGAHVRIIILQCESRCISPVIFVFVFHPCRQGRVEVVSFYSVAKLNKSTIFWLSLLITRQPTKVKLSFEHYSEKINLRRFCNLSILSRGIDNAVSLLKLDFNAASKMGDLKNEPFNLDDRSTYSKIDCCDLFGNFLDFFI